MKLESLLSAQIECAAGKLLIQSNLVQWTDVRIQSSNTYLVGRLDTIWQWQIYVDFLLCQLLSSVLVLSLI